MKFIKYLSYDKKASNVVSNSYKLGFLILTIIAVKFVRLKAKTGTNLRNEQDLLVFSQKNINDLFT